MSTTLTISPATFEHLAQHAAQAGRTPDELADELLHSDEQTTEHPYVNATRRHANYSQHPFSGLVYCGLVEKRR